MENKNITETNNVYSVNAQNNEFNTESCTTKSAALVSQQNGPKMSGCDVLADSAECVLCKENEKGSAECFACFDMAMLKQGTEKKKLKVFTVEAASCKKCRTKYNLIKYIPTFITLLISVIAVAILSVRTVYESLASCFFALPLVVMVAAVCVAMSVASVIKSLLINKYSRTTHLNVFELSGMAELKEQGAVELNAKSSISNPVFSDERLEK